MSPEPKPRLRRCAFYPTTATAVDGTRICSCGGLETDAVHRKAVTTDEDRAADARRIGER